VARLLLLLAFAALLASLVAQSTTGILD